jgi:hypothetical protein
MAKKVIRLTESELTDLIQKIVVETRMSEMDVPEMEEGELEEGMFGPSSEELEERKTELIRKIDDLLEEYNLTEEDLFDPSRGRGMSPIDRVLRKAEEDGFNGEVKLEQGRGGNLVLLFVPAPSKFHKSKFYQNVVKPMVGGMKGGHEFGGGE